MILNKEEFQNSKRKFLKQMETEIFIYPTDTIYGLGCDATNEEAIAKIREIKGSGIQPYSIIAPNKKWVYENCYVGEKEKPFVEKLGTYIEINGQEHRFTIILKLKNKDAIAKNVSPGKDTIGVRIPNNWFSKIVEEFEKPIITTSANKTGSDFMTNKDNLNIKIKNKIAFIVYEGEKKGKPSTIINLADRQEDIQIKDRRE
ncbi:Sua5/YciO/YrdC/YwlC family protein [Candidatus Woesearchaeota archaeon]|nr:Sua5/YciO/YrdC/YwlC family protein [Candidatus Woesearchaeota archaeon]MCF7901389.1 Sua5/YciO/YrdC/YwlC family protein [Candidatus Woesearchaeota archaeon]MCF8013140.1 Sua5/YciO/YrdC/YwlC family protein [Candidatus Woesearchaeota archaeon]